MKRLNVFRCLHTCNRCNSYFVWNRRFFVNVLFCYRVVRSRDGHIVGLEYGSLRTMSAISVPGEGWRLPCKASIIRLFSSSPPIVQYLLDDVGRHPRIWSWRHRKTSSCFMMTDDHRFREKYNFKVNLLFPVPLPICLSKQFYITLMNPTIPFS